ncbi:SH3 domain-containing C40 family peptidase [Arenibacter sp. F20364]|uniref:SH3 domain-containing C40 family peptidase n=1 Tax=Arenibacter sp. F20364 TaxID=2926415 RepID=UPI001FF6501D|nr:SH3 domain-containing C40 family peptidase [Arenibacter sp. F20364]MCK0189731.1 C40 family peptidase [Arenibacter sp. F20364]
MNYGRNGIIFLLITGIFLFLSCDQKVDQNELTIKVMVEDIKQEFAPDKRVALFNMEFAKEGNETIIKGESNLPDAVASFKQKLAKENINYIDSIQLLPSSNLNGYTQGLITISVANLRSKPSHSSELVTQATLGTPVKILKEEDNWYLIQTPDKYLSWVDRGGIMPLTVGEYSEWKSSPKVIYTNTIGHSYTDSNKGTQVVSDMVAGGVLERLGVEKEFYYVSFPDGRKAYVHKTEAMDYDSWLAALDPSQESLVSTSKTLMGVPYLWGGTSTKGVDCSGFTKTIYFLNGIVLPRDASQQIHTGKEIDAVKDFDKLEPGDLLFFGKPATDTTKERVIHVGMWIGNNEFIHSAGRVHISSMDKDAPNYDEYNLNRYLRSNRYLKEPKDGLIELAKTPVFKD